MRVQKCVKGSSVAYPDEQTHAAITKGHCIPSCNLDIGAIKCTFDTRFRDETSIQASDLMTAPFTMITGMDFKHMQTVRTTETIAGTTEGTGTIYASEQTGRTTVVTFVIATVENEGMVIGAGQAGASSQTASSTTTTTKTAYGTVEAAEGEAVGTGVVGQTSTAQQTTTAGSVSCESGKQICGCQLVPTSEMSRLEKVTALSLVQHDSGVTMTDCITGVQTRSFVHGILFGDNL